MIWGQEKIPYNERLKKLQAILFTKEKVKMLLDLGHYIPTCRRGFFCISLYFDLIAKITGSTFEGKTLDFFGRNKLQSF